MIKLTFLLLTVLLHIVSGNNNFVENVQQGYTTKTNVMLTEQIEKELSASYIYQAYASYFQRADVSLPGISKFFSDASLEERGHAQSLIDYINKRGGQSLFNKIELKPACEEVTAFLKNDTGGLSDRTNAMCICDFVVSKTSENCTSRNEWKDGLMAFEDALAIERYVNLRLLAIHKAAADDAHLTHILEHEFLEEQVSSINKLAHYVTRLRSFVEHHNYKLGEYIFDQHLSK